MKENMVIGLVSHTFLLTDNAPEITVCKLKGCVNGVLKVNASKSKVVVLKRV